MTSWYAVRLDFSVCFANGIFFRTYLQEKEKEVHKIGFHEITMSQNDLSLIITEVNNLDIEYTTDSVQLHFRKK